MPWGYLCARMLPRLYGTQCVQQNCALLGYNAESGGNSLPTFWDNLSVLSSRVKNPKTVQKSAVLTFFVVEAWHQGIQGWEVVLSLQNAWRESRHHQFAWHTWPHVCYLPYSSLGQEFCKLKFIKKLEKSSHPAFNIHGQTIKFANSSR